MPEKPGDSREPVEPRADQPRADQARADQPRAEQPRADQPRPEQSGGGRDLSRGQHRRTTPTPEHSADNGRERCPVCRSTRLSIVDVTLSDGSPVSMVSCQDCEHRVWRRPNGEPVDLQEVLDKAPRSRRRRPGT